MTRVLIVDDDATLRRTIGRDLGNQGYAVLLAEDADSAAALLAERGVDVLLTDLRMPCADGIDLLERARALSPRTRSILMSGFATARDYQRAIEVGAVRVLCKPFTSGELVQAIEFAVDCETGFRGNIHALSLIDLLQMFHFARRTLAITMEGGAAAQVCFEEGRIVHASYGELVGEPALHAVLSVPAGTLRTTVLSPDTPRTIRRDFEPLLLDALRTLDERLRDGPPRDPEFHFDLPLAAPAHPGIEWFADKLRTVDGYTAAFLVDCETGVVLGSDGSAGGVDVRAAAAGYAELYQAELAALETMGLEERLESILITLARQYHVLCAVANSPSLFVCAILERSGGNLGLLRLALERLGSTAVGAGAGW